MKCRYLLYVLMGCLLCSCSSSNSLSERVIVDENPIEDYADKREFSVSENVVLGVHTDVLGRAGYTSGHAWITVTHNGVTKYYGFWADDHSLTPNNGPGWDIRKGMEKSTKPKASRYYKLSAEQKKILDPLLLENLTWSLTHNCASWAREIIWKVVGENINAADGLWFIETPRALGHNIMLLEAKDPTGRNKPEDLTTQD